MSLAKRSPVIGFALALATLIAIAWWLNESSAGSTPNSLADAGHDPALETTLPDDRPQAIGNAGSDATLEVSAQPELLRTTRPEVNSAEGTLRHVTITVVDLDGDPLPGVTIEVLPPKHAAMAAPLSATTGEDGVAQIDGVAQQGRSTWRVSTPGVRFVQLRKAGDLTAVRAWPLAVFHRDALTEGDLPPFLEVRLEFAAATFAAGISGRVVGPDGQARKGVRLAAHRQLAPGEPPDWNQDDHGGHFDPVWQRLAHATTDAEGAFTIEELPAGRLRLVGEFSDAPGEVQVVHADLEVVQGEHQDLGALPLGRGSPPQLFHFQPTLDGVSVAPQELWEQPGAHRWSVRLFPVGDWPGIYLPGSQAMGAPLTVYNLPPSRWRAERAYGRGMHSSVYDGLRRGILPSQRWGDNEVVAFPSAPLEVLLPFHHASSAWFEVTDDFGLPRRGSLSFDVYYSDLEVYGELYAKLPFEDGGIGFEFPPGSYVLSVQQWTRSERRILALIPFEVPSAEPARIPLRLQRPVTLQGTLRNSSGVALEGVTLAAVPEGGDDFLFTARGFPRATTDPSGRFELAPLPAQARIDILAATTAYNISNASETISTPVGSETLNRDLVWDAPTDR